MKKIFLLTTLFLISLCGFGQTYDPVLKPGAFWDTRQWSAGSTCSSYHRLQIDGETTLNATVYKTLKTAPLRDVNDQTNCITGEFHVNPEDFTTVENMYLREDQTERKVYIYTNLFDGIFKEYVLCDFSLEVGDSMTNYFSSAEGIPLTVVSITTNSDNRKVYEMSDGSSFIEGVGKNEGNTSDYHTLVDFVYFENHCYGDAGNQNSCAEVLSIEDEQLAQIKIFPNPTSDKISISSSLDHTFKLYSMLGKEIPINFSKENQEIDIAHLQSGIYLLEIHGANGGKRVVKVLKD